MFAKRLVVLCCLILVGSAQGGLITDAVPVGTAVDLGRNEDAVGALWVHAADGWRMSSAFLSERTDRITFTGHQLDHPGIDDVRIYFGSDIYNAPYQAIKVTSWKTHPDYVPGTVGTTPDLAVGVLEKPAVGITPLKYWSGSDVLGDEFTMVDFGMWGNNALGDQPQDGVRRGGTNRIYKLGFALYSSDYIIADTDRPGYSQATLYESALGPGGSGSPAIIERNGIKYANGVACFIDPGNLSPGQLYNRWTGYYRTSQQYDWLMTTVPEPTTIVLTFCGVVVMLRRRVRS